MSPIHAMQKTIYTTRVQTIHYIAKPYQNCQMQTEIYNDNNHNNIDRNMQPNSLTNKKKKKFTKLKRTIILYYVLPSLNLNVNTLHIKLTLWCQCLDRSLGHLLTASPVTMVNAFVEN